MRGAIFTDEHEALRESIRSFVDREVVPHVEEWEETTFPDSIVKRMGELGFLGLSLPEQYGGQGGDYFANIVLAEEIARAAAAASSWACRSTPTWSCRRSSSSAPTSRRSASCRRASPASRSTALGITEPDAGSDVAGIKTRAVRDGDEWVINGSKTYITNGHRADMIVLVTKTDPDAGYDGFTLFLVPMDTPGVIREQKLQKMGMHASDTALLAFQDVRVPGQRGPRPGRQGLLPHHVGAAGRALHRHRRAVSPTRSTPSTRPSNTPASARPSASRSAPTRRSATSSRRWRRTSRPRAS